MRGGSGRLGAGAALARTVATACCWVRVEPTENAEPAARLRLATTCIRNASGRVSGGGQARPAGAGVTPSGPMPAKRPASSASSRPVSPACSAALHLSRIEPMLSAMVVGVLSQMVVVLSHPLSCGGVSGVTAPWTRARPISISTHPVRRLTGRCRVWGWRGVCRRADLRSSCSCRRLSSSVRNGWMSMILTSSRCGSGVLTLPPGAAWS